MTINAQIRQINDLFKQLKDLEEQTRIIHREVDDLTFELIGRLTYERQLDKAGGYVRAQIDRTIYAIREKGTQLRELRETRIDLYTKIGMEISEIISLHTEAMVEGL